MESLTTKEFLDKLKANNLKPAFVLKGLVKASEKDSELQFAHKQDSVHWVALPASMIESVVVLKSLPNKYEPSAFVKLQLKCPSDPEAKALYELLASSAEEGCHACLCGTKKELTHEHGQHFQFAGIHAAHYCPCCGHNCSCGCMNKKYPEHADCHKSGMQV